MTVGRRSTVLTRRGWLLGAGAVVLVSGGRLLGLVELYVMAAGALLLGVAALVFVRACPVKVRVQRTLHPPRVHAGGASRVELSLTNTGSRRTPVLGVCDPFDRGWRWARFHVAPLPAGESTRAAYRLPTQDRGLYDVGPLDVTLTDPFALAVRRLPAAPVTQLTVYPRIDPIVPLPHTLGRDPHAGAGRNTPSSIGEEFHSLRPYELGDDLRRVHWPSTARQDELMIRRDELPWQGRATVLLDVRTGVHTPESLEDAVSAAASIVDASWRGRGLIRLIASNGADSGFAAGHRHVESILEHLATIEASAADKLTGVLTRLHRAGNAGALAVVTTAGTGTRELDGFTRLRRRFGIVVLVLIEQRLSRAATLGRRAPRKALPGDATVVRVTEREPFATAWDRVMTAPRVGARR